MPNARTWPPRPRWYYVALGVACISLNAVPDAYLRTGWGMAIAAGLVLLAVAEIWWMWRALPQGTESV